MTDLTKDLAVLDRMEQLLDSPEKWGKENYLTDVDGYAADLTFELEQIGQMCLLGAEAYAFAWVYDDQSEDPDDVLSHIHGTSYRFDRALAEAVELDKTSYIPEWNDAEGRTYEEVMAVIRKAKQILQQEVIDGSM